MTPRILHLTKYLPSYYGGIERVTAAMSLAAQEMGARVEILGLEKKEIRIRDQRYYGKLIGIDSFVRLGSLPIAPGIFNMLDTVKRADIIHVHLPNPIVEIALLHFLERRTPNQSPKLIPVFHAGIVKLLPFGRIWGNLLQRRLLSYSDRIIVSAPQLKSFVPVDRKFRSRIRIIPFTSTHRCPTDADGTSKRSRTIQLFALGRLVPYKGYDLLIDALSGLAGNWKLSIAGDGPCFKSLQSQIKRANLTRKIKLLRRVSEKRKLSLLQDCDLFLAPSQSEAEGYGVSLVEAFSFGKPVVTTNLKTGVAYLARNGACGAVVPVGSALKLRQAISELMLDGHRRETTGVENYKFWKTQLSQEVFQSRYAKMIREIWPSEGFLN